MTAMKKIKILHLMIQTCLRLCQSLQYLQVNSFCPIVHRKEAIDQALKAKRPTATHIMLRDYYEIFKEAFSDQTAFSDASDIAASSADPEMCLKHHFSAAMEAQAAWIEQQKHMQLHGKRQRKSIHKCYK